MGTIYGISFSIAGFVTATMGALIATIGQSPIYSGFVFPLIWGLTFRTLRQSNVRNMHTKERALLVQIGTRIAKEHLLSELEGVTMASEVDPTRSPFVEEARKCISYYMRM